MSNNRSKIKKLSRLTIIISALEDTFNPEATFTSIRRQARSYRIILLATESILEKYSHLFKADHVTVIKADDKSPAEALNIGLAAVTTPFVTFMRLGDKTVNEAYYKSCVSYLDSHSDTIDYVSTRTFIKNELTKKRINHPSNPLIYWSNEEPQYIADLNKTPEMINTVLYGGAFKTSVAKEIGFNTDIKYEYAEDFMLRLALKHPKFGVIRIPAYTSAHAFENSHAIYAPTLHSEWYMESLEKFFMPLAENNPPLYIQYALLYLLQWKFIANQDTRDKLVLAGDEIDGFFNSAKKVLEHISDKCFFTSERWFKLPVQMKIILAQLKYGDFNIPLSFKKGLNPNGENDLIAFFNDNPCDHLDRSPIGISLMNYDNGELEIYASYPRIFYPHCKIYASFNGERYDVIPADRYTLTKYFGRSAFKYFTFKVNIPVNGRPGEVKFHVECEEFSICPRLIFTYSHARLTQNLKASYWCKDGMIFHRDNANTLNLRRNTCSLHFKHELKLWFNILRKGSYRKRLRIMSVGLRALYWLTRLSYSKRHIWVTFDKLYKGGDCGEYFYRYAEAQNDGIEVQYILNGDSPFFPMLKKEGYRPARRKSLRQLLGVLNADIIFATHAGVYSFCGFEKNKELFFRDLFKFDVVCIQHGLTTQAIAMHQHKLKDNTRRYYCASKYEIESLKHPIYGYDPDDLCLTGIPRHDGLLDCSKKQILITPTWRQNLALPAIMGQARRYNPEFKNSTYFKRINELITDPRLIECARKNGYQIKYLLHPTISIQAEDYDISGAEDVVELLTGAGDLSYEQLLTESALMVTDYSGVQFDFAYQRKPIVYYHHNEIPPHYEEGCFNYDTMAFGEICTDNSSTVDMLIYYMENGCRMKNEYIARADDFFAFDDQNNCARIYSDAMEHLQKKFM